MISSEINKTIESYVRQNLSPKPEERDFITARYEELSKILEGESFQSGSYARFTSITPVNDLDVIWVLPPRFLEKAVEPQELDAANILKDLARKLEEEYEDLDLAVRIEPQSHSVGIFFGEADEEFSIDIVPAVPMGSTNEFGEDMYYVPEIARLSKNKRIRKYSSGEAIEWIKSDPKGYKKFAANINERNDSFRKAAKFLKKWKWGCKKNFEDFPLKSFHLELIVMSVFEEKQKLDSYEAIQYIFSNFENYLDEPHFRDRADSTKYIDEYLRELDEESKEKIKVFVKSGGIFLQMIEKSETAEEVVRLLQRLFSGEEFIEAHDVIIAIDQNLTLKIDGWVRPKKKGSFRGYWLKSKDGDVVWKREIDFQMLEKSNLPQNVVLKWKVRNTGEDAREKDSLRGEITEKHTRRTPELTLHRGVHYVECYAIQNNTCIARDRVEVHISR